MRKLLIYSVPVVVLFSGGKELKSLWQPSPAQEPGKAQTIGDRVDTALGKAKDIYSHLTKKGKELKDDLNGKIKIANDEYLRIRKEIEEKNQQLQNTLKAIEDAKKALDELLKKEEGGK